MHQSYAYMHCIYPPEEQDFHEVIGVYEAQRIYICMQPCPPLPIRLLSFSPGRIDQAFTSQYMLHMSVPPWLVSANIHAFSCIYMHSSNDHLNSCFSQFPCTVFTRISRDHADSGPETGVCWSLVPFLLFGRPVC